jgi:hypothetical protein
MPIFFFSNGYSGLFSRLTDTIGFDKYFRNDLAFAFLKGNIVKGAEMIFSAPKEIVILIVGILIWFLMFLLAIAGFCQLFLKSQNNQKIMIGTIGILLLYFAFIVSPGIIARYHLPVNPFIFIFAISGLNYIKSLFIKNV